ncbi:FERM and PDZ domain-containing 4, partial [Paramuricea clavata]
ESTQELNLEVIASDDVQDVRNRGQRKSSIMSRTTRERRRSNPVSVRFADTPVLVQYVGSPPSYPLRRSSLPLIPNVLKIYLENGQTRSFLYNSRTVVKDMFASLADKIGLKRLDRFAFVLQATQTLNDYIVQANERVSQVYARRNCNSSAWLSKLLLIFAPKDIHLFLKEDPVAFDYFYRQMCSQVVEGRFGWELKYDTAIKLAALHLQQYALEEKIGKGGKISVKAIEREVGSLENFVPTALIDTMQKKDLQRILTQQIKQTRNLCPPGQKYISPLQAKLQYLKICSEMKTYGGKQFNAVVVDPTAEDQKFFQDQKINSVIFVGPNIGLAQVTNPRSFSMHQIAEFSQINGLVITPHTEGKQNIKLFLNNGKSVTLIMGPIFETRDLVYLISGYHKHLVENARPLSVIDMTSPADVEEPVDEEVPSYSDIHQVLLDDCSYRRNGNENDEDVRQIAFRQRPDFENSELYSLADHSKNTQPPTRLSNGSVKTHLSILVNNNQSLNSIEEEALSLTSPKSGILLSPEKRTYMNGVREPKRKSFMLLSDDLTSESTDEERTDDVKTASLDKEQDTKNGSDSLMTNATKSPVRNHSSIHVSSPSHNSEHVEPMDNSGDLYNGDIMGHVHEVQVDIPLTPSLPSSVSNTSDEISSLSSNSSRTSPLTISSALLLKHQTSKEVVLVSGGSSPTTDADASMENSSEEKNNEKVHACDTKTNDTTTDPEASMENSSEEKNNEEVHACDTKTNGTTTNPGTSMENSSEEKNNEEVHDCDTKTNNIIGSESPAEEIQTNGTDACDGNTLGISNTAVTKDNNLQNGSSLSEVQVNGDIKTLPFKQKRRRSSGYIAYNGGFRQDLHVPECIIHDDITLTIDQATEDNKSNSSSQEQSTSRSDACDHALKTFYSLKTKLNTLKHSIRPVRTNNEIVRSRKQSMIEIIGVLEECNEQIKDLTTADEKDVVEAILRTRSSLSQLTESCTLAYNAQYSMKHFTTDLIESIDKHIDVLITTDAWNTTPVSDLTRELHKDKCELVHDSLESLRKSINKL